MEFVLEGFQNDNESFESIPELYKSAHAAIRADPNKKRDDKELGRFKTRSGKKPEATTYKPKRYGKLTLAERRNRVAQILKARGVDPIVVQQ